MFLLTPKTELYLPHTRGDEPDWCIMMAMFFAHLPHTRGDEPGWELCANSNPEICPTRVGMNRYSPTYTL